MVAQAQHFSTFRHVAWILVALVQRVVSGSAQRHLQEHCWAEDLHSVEQSTGIHTLEVREIIESKCSSFYVILKGGFKFKQF